MTEKMLVVDRDINNLRKRVNFSKELISKLLNNDIDYDDVYKYVRTLGGDLELIIIFGMYDYSNSEEIELINIYIDFWKSIFDTDDEDLTNVFYEVNKGGHSIVIRAYLESKIELSDTQKSAVFLHEKRKVHLFKLDEIVSINELLRQCMFFYLITGDDSHIETISNVSNEISHTIKTPMAIDEYLRRNKNR